MSLSLFQLHGDLSELRFPRLLAALFQDGFTGVLQATCRAEPAGREQPAGREAGAPADPAEADSGDTTREVHLANGHIAWAISTDPEESLKATLLRAGTVTPAQWAEAEQRAREGSLREALVTGGLISARELGQIERGRVEGIVLSLFAPRAGEYRIRERQLAPGTADLMMDPRPLILRGVPEWADRALVLEEIGSLDAVYTVRRAGPDDADLLLPQEYVALLRHLDGEASIARVCGANSLPDHYVCSLFAALSLAGVIRRRPEKTPARVPRAAQIEERELPPAAPLAEPAPQPRGLQMALPPISTEPFPGEGPTTEVEALAEDELEPAEVLEAGPEEEPQEVVEATVETTDFEKADFETADFEPDNDEDACYENEVTPEVLPVADARLEDVELEPELDLDMPPAAAAARREALREAPREAQSAYAAGSIPESQRPWFLLGGGAAVGIAALFLILMTQGPSESTEQGPPPERVVTTSAPYAAEKTDIQETPAPQTPPPPAAYRPASASVLEPVAKPSRRPAPQVAAPSRQPILKRGGAPSGPASDATAQARRSLSTGDYAGAARHYSRALRSASQAYSVQIMAACQPETIRGILRRGQGSSQMFILPATLQGRECYRIYWGRYRSYEAAREALRKDVPATLRQADTPRVARVGGA